MRSHIQTLLKYTQIPPAIAYHLFWQVGSFLLYTSLQALRILTSKHTSYVESMQQENKKADKALIGNLFRSPQIRLVILMPKPNKTPKAHKVLLS